MKARVSLPEMKDVDDALSRSARAVTVEPSGADTWTMHVISNVLAQIFMAVFDETGMGELEVSGTSPEDGLTVSLFST